MNTEPNTELEDLEQPEEQTISGGVGARASFNGQTLAHADVTTSESSVSTVGLTTSAAVDDGQIDVEIRNDR